MKILRDQWFLILLMLALSLGYVFAYPLSWLTDIAWLKWLIVGLTMLCMTWPLETKQLVRAGTKPLAPSIAIFLNLVAAPLLAWPLSRFLGSELGPGLILAAAVPSTLASSAVWTRRAGGNDSVSMVVTIVTNLLCFVVTPAWVYGLIGISVPQSVLVATIVNLGMFVVFPMVIGQLLRIHRGSATWATNHASRLSIAAQIGILLITLIGSVSMRIRFDGLPANEIGLNHLAATIVLVLFHHLAILISGIKLGEWTGCPIGDRIAIGFGGSQKTLMVGLSTALSMGLNIIPIVAYHALQLIVDTLIADRFRKRFT